MAAASLDNFTESSPCRRAVVMMARACLRVANAGSKSESRNRYSDTSGSSPRHRRQHVQHGAVAQVLLLQRRHELAEAIPRHVVETRVGQVRHHQGIGQQEVRQCLRFRTHCQQRAIEEVEREKEARKHDHVLDGCQLCKMADPEHGEKLRVEEERQKAEVEKYLGRYFAELLGRHSTE